MFWMIEITKYNIIKSYEFVSHNENIKRNYNPNFL